MAWHSAGTYRVGDGRGGATSGSQRFAPLNSWPDNVSLDKARRLIWPIKAKYGRKLSWADLLILTGNVALESMGFETHGFAGGRVDIWEPEEDINWGPETEWLDDERYEGDREMIGELGAVQMGLIYVNPEGPNGNPDPKLSAHDIRDTFMRMAMNDEETVALVAGGHTFGKAHGAGDPGQFVGAEPEGAALENQGLGWTNTMGTGHGVDTISSGVEGAWTKTPTTWDNSFFDTLFGFEWELTKSPAGAHQWTAIGGEGTVPDAHDPSRSHAPMMTTADLALREDPAYAKISKRFHENPAEFAEAFSKAWYKLTHRDMGPYELGLGKLVPAQAELWQDPVPAPTAAPLSDADLATLKGKLLDALPIATLVKTAWASAASFRGSDKRGGANGARIRLSPAKDWEVNNPAELAATLKTIEGIQADFGADKVSIADLIVLGGSAAVEQAAKNAGHTVAVPFTGGRTDASQAQTDVESYAWLEPKSDGFRNFHGKSVRATPAEMLVDKAQLLTLTGPEMTVLVGGMRVLGANTDGSDNGVFTNKTDTLSNDYFANLLDMGTVWSATSKNSYEGKDRATGAAKWSATSVDLVFGSNSILRALAEVYAADDASEKFARDFAAAWTKVMNLDRFNIA